MEDLNQNRSMFSKIFFETIMHLDNRADDDLLAIKRELNYFVDGKSSTARAGIQSKISLFFDCVRRKIEIISENDLQKVLKSKERYTFFAKVVESLGLIYYQSVKKNRGVNYPDKDSLEKIIGSFITNIPKANENFANYLFPTDKKLSLKTISELSAFICLISVIFNANVEKIEEVILQELRKYVKIYINNQAFIQEVNNCGFNKTVLIDGEVYDFTEVLNKFNQVATIDERYFIMGKLLFVLLYFTDCKAPTDGAKENYIQWINNVQDEILKIANGYSKYLWIRYRRLPGVELSAEQLNGYTIDNLYVFPGLYKVGDNSGEKLFDGFFDKDSKKRMRRAVISAHGTGKTALLNTIISMVPINSDYAIRGMNISNYFANFYNKIRTSLGFKTTDVFPLVITGKKFDSFLDYWNEKEQKKNPSLVDFSYYLIMSYNEELNIIGERNKGWYEKWIANFSFKQFQNLLKGAVEDDRLLLLIDDCEIVKNKEEFEQTVNEFLINYGSNCDIIVTATEQDNLPQFITKIKNGFDVFKIEKLKSDQAEDVFARHYVYFKNPENMQQQKQSVIDVYEFDEGSIEKKEQGFVDFVLEESQDSKFLNEKIKRDCKEIFLNPLVLSKAAQATVYDNSDFNLDNLDQESFFEILPVLSEDKDSEGLLNALIPKMLFEVVQRATTSAIPDGKSIKKYYKLLNKNMQLIKNQDVKQMLITSNRLLKSYIDQEEL